MSKDNKKTTNWRTIHNDMTAEGIKLSYEANMKYVLAKDQYSSTTFDKYLALSYSIRDRLVDRWINTQQRYHKQNLKRVYYLSLEFLIGRLLGNYVYNFGLDKESEEAVESLGLDLEELRDQETDAGLGNGGLGRLATCFLDSMATLKIPSHGYGIRYDYGIFKQKIENGFQVELPDEWLRLGSPWEFPRPEYSQLVKFYGRVDESNNWVGTEDVLAVPYDVPILGYKNDVVNTLRLWSARSTDEFDFDYFNHGDYEQAVYKKIFSENISKVLYPNDAQAVGRELRLKQEYFFTSASIADILRRFQSENSDFTKLPDQASIQLNDTHPALGVVELMRVLVDNHKIDWDTAWDITRNTFAYTNHTLMPEALECWSVDLLGKVLPRHLQIIYELNEKFINEIRAKYPGDEDRVSRMSLIGEGDTKMARMAYLSIVGSYSVNGVSALHTELLKENLFKDFHEFYPTKINNKTNGITQRRWLLKSNPRLSDLINSSIGDKWIVELDDLKRLEAYSTKSAFIKKWQQVKLDNKKELAEYISKTMDVTVDPNSMFDVQIKRIHEYKRQMMFALYIISQYLRIKNDPKKFKQPRTFIIGGKAAPGYYMAKLGIKFINSIANVINNDKDVSDKLKLVFLENYRVSLAEKIFPASELSEQISTAGTEASGTGNMKFMLNGALTIGTLDGANVEMAECLDKDDIFIFGLKTKEVQELKHNGYDPQHYVHKSPVLKEIYNMMTSKFFCKEQTDLFDPLVDSLFYHDQYLVCADFDSYCAMQDQVSEQYLDPQKWTSKSILNVANVGKFSSDRTISDYARDIWHVPVNK